MEKRNEVLLNYVKNALQRGYSESDLRKNLLDNRVSWVEAASLLATAKTELGLHNKKPQEEIIEKQPRRLPALIIVLAGIVAMVIVYLYRFISPELLDFPSLGFFNKIWPVMFPIVANLVNLAFFRKRFLFGFIITLVVFLVIGGLILVLAAVGL